MQDEKYRVLFTTFIDDQENLNLKKKRIRNKKKKPNIWELYTRCAYDFACSLKPFF
jgi:hypothetical protein